MKCDSLVGLTMDYRWFFAPFTISYDKVVCISSCNLLQFSVTEWTFKCSMITFLQQLLLKVLILKLLIYVYICDRFVFRHQSTFLWEKLDLRICLASVGFMVGWQPGKQTTHGWIQNSLYAKLFRYLATTFNISAMLL